MVSFLWPGCICYPVTVTKRDICFLSLEDFFYKTFISTPKGRLSRHTRCLSKTLSLFQFAPPTYPSCYLLLGSVLPFLRHLVLNLEGPLWGSSLLFYIFRMTFLSLHSHVTQGHTDSAFLTYQVSLVAWLVNNPRAMQMQFDSDRWMKLRCPQEVGLRR